MTRPRLLRKIGFNPHVTYFKPQGVPLRSLEVVELSVEEVESYRLRHLKGLDQRQAASFMQTSASTYQRIYYSANKKIADAIINGKAIKIIK